MISGSVVAAFAVAALATFVFPIVLLLVLCLRHQIGQKPMWIGAAAFFVSQICLRLPILSALGTQNWFLSFAENTIPYVVVLAFTAGLFEESARYVGARVLLKDRRQFRDTVAFGLGHGVCEAVLIVGLTEVSNLVFCLMLDSGALSPSDPALKASVDALMAVAPSTVYLAIWERIFTVLFHVFAAVLIFRGVREKKLRYYWYALAAHTAVDTGSVLLSRFGNVWAGELWVGAAGAVGLILTLRLRRSFENRSPSAESL